jgi:predicted HAD superfamily Cof-like phosphohydrolase
MSTPLPKCVDLARHLAVLNKQQDDLDNTCLLLNKDSEEHRRAYCAMNDTWRQIWAVEELILTMPAVSLADAAALLLMAISKVHYVVDMEDAKEELEKAERAMDSALRVVAAAAGLSPDEMGFMFYLRDLPAAEPGGET